MFVVRVHSSSSRPSRVTSQGYYATTVSVSCSHRKQIMCLEISGKLSKVIPHIGLQPSLDLLCPASQTVKSDREDPEGDKSLPDDVCLHACAGLKDERDGRAVLIVFGALLAILAAVLYGDRLSSWGQGKTAQSVFLQRLQLQLSTWSP